MKYSLLIYSDEKAGANASKEEMDMVFQEYAAYTEALQKAGVMTGGEALHPTSSATTVRMQNGKQLTVHGPFAETKEQLGGFYLLDCENLDQAIEWAAKLPAVRFGGSVEIRPVMEFE